ncbi:MAG: putative membrane protein, partial [Glaciecola sp.]
MESMDKIQKLLFQIESLSTRQNSFVQEIEKLKKEINELKGEVKPDTSSDYIITTPTEPTNHSDTAIISLEKEPEFKRTVQELPSIKQEAPKVQQPKKTTPKPGVKKDWEKFIGENLISKIGIIITIIGVGIGAKYSIENDLVSPLTRIILGYLVGLGLLIFGIKLKAKYEKYSAVLVSGAIAIMFFITYSGYSFYGLFPQVFAFGLMVVFTAFTVVAAVKYNQQIIALIGLVGAYAVPFLLSTGSGQVEVLFTYMSIVNIGILVIAFKKYWKLIYYVAFGLTWVIFASWYVMDYQMGKHFTLALLFLLVFFTIFYMVFLSYKLIKKELFVISDVVLLLLNSFIFYGLGYALLNEHDTGKELLGIFTLCNGILHFAFSAVIYKRKLADKNIYYLISGLVLVFLTIAIPVQLDGNWVTLLWIGEATILYWIGRTKGIQVYETLSYPLIILSFFSLIQDWESSYYLYELSVIDSKLTPLLNINFLSSTLYIVSLGYIVYLSLNNKYTSILDKNKDLAATAAVVVPGILLAVVYYSFRIELDNYWDQLYNASYVPILNEHRLYGPGSLFNYNLNNFKSIWILNYSLLFVSILSILNIKVFKRKLLFELCLIANVVVMLVFLTQGLYAISELRESYLSQKSAEYYDISSFNLGIRYVSYGFFAVSMYATYLCFKKSKIAIPLKLIFDVLIHVSLLWILSSELINWLDIMESDQSHKLGLSILWGVYALATVVLGIINKKQHLRIGAIILFAVTLIKLFLYDISHLDTIA